MGEVDLKSPWQGRRAAEELLVEPVPETSDGLSGQDARCQGIGHRGEHDPLVAAVPPDRQASQGDGAPDAEPAFPDVEAVVPGTAGTEVELMVCDDVVQAPTDDASDDREGT